MKKTLQFLFYSLLASGTITTAYANHLSDVVVATQSAPVEFNVLTSSENLQAVISQAEALYNVHVKGALKLNGVIEIANSKLTGSNAEVEKAIKDLKAAILVYNLSNATPDTPFDMTSYITNPSFDNNDGEGWKGIGVINYNEVEFYEKIFDMYQDIEGLPAGKYRMTSKGFERPKPNDSGTAYNNGTEVMSAKFYAKATSFPQKNAMFICI